MSLSPAAQRRLRALRPGERIDMEFALELAQHASVHELGEAALRQRRARHGDRAYFVYNQHINYTDVCRNACRFCAYSKRVGDPTGKTLSLEEIAQCLRERLHEPVREIHIVGGLNPELPQEYYLEMLRLCKKLRPEATLKAFTAVEIAYFADTWKMTEEAVLELLRQAGLDVLPGGGAEVFDSRMRQKLCPEKIAAERWLAIHALAHRMGMPTNCTMLFGHVEGWHERIAHLAALRALEDESPGFVCFIPLPYQPKNTGLGVPGPTGEDILRMVAVSRLVLDNIAHIKAYWAFMGIKMAQLALWSGADDLDGTILGERIGHAAGAATPQALTMEELQETIRSAGFVPVERNTVFQPLTS
jgi:aminodeoxyfutalosine synthase